MTHALPHGRGIIGAVLLALALVGCSTVKLGYNNLPELTYWWLDSYMGFTDEQAPQVRAELARLHRWHRQAELPRLAQQLRRMEQLAPLDVDERQACEFAGEFRQRLRALREQAEPALASLAAGIAPGQLGQLASRQERNNREFRRKWLGPDPQEQAEARIKQFQQHAERLYGRLEPAQRTVLRERLARSVFDPGRTLAERQRRQADLRQVLQQIHAGGLDAAQAQPLIASWLDRVERSPDPAWIRYQDELMRESCAVFASLHNAASPAQRQSAVERLQGWQRDLADLAGRS